MKKPTLKTVEKYEIMAKNSRHIWTKGEIHALGKLLNRFDYLSDNEIKSRIAALAEYVQVEMKPARITPEQTKFGLEWLNATLNRPNGQPRKSKLAECLEPLRGPLSRFKEFRFSGFNTQDGYNGRVFFIAPIYEVIGKNGENVPYSHQHWGETSVGHYCLSQNYPYFRSELSLTLIQGGTA